MLKTKLPVIVLRNMILLPSGEIKLEIQEVTDKSIIEEAINEHNGYVLLVTPKYATMEDINKDELPLFGIIGKINSNFELPNGNIRITLFGINRAVVYDYLEKDGFKLDAVIGPVNIKEVPIEVEEARVRILKNEFEKYVEVMPTVSNYLVAKINEETSLENLTDIIVNVLPLSFDDKYKFIEEKDSLVRCDILVNLLNKEKNIGSIEKDIESKLKVSMEETQREFVLRERLKVIKKELHEDDSKDREIEELNDKINKLKAPKEIKEKLFKEVKKYESMPISSPEVTICKNYIDTCLSLPWNIYTEDEEDLDKCEKILDSSHYGLDKIKERIIEYIAVNKMTKENKSPILCLVGPPGVGKTTLAFSIAKALNKNFVKISVGGVSDESEIVGHRRTYIGAEPGRIINTMIKAKSSNPLFLIDEIDKMSKGHNGDPESAILEVLDKEQNKYFKDNFLEEEYDLSKVMFVLTANDINSIPYPLLDRLEIIELSSYTAFEKFRIVKNLMFDKLLSNHGLSKNNFSIDDDALHYIIENYTKEAGVRELERVLSKVMRKAVRKILKEKNIKININKDNIYDYLGKEKYKMLKNIKNDSGVVNGLGYTPFGGVILPIEVSCYKGSGNIVLTGSLGDVMKESANIAVGFVKSNLEKFGIKEDFFKKNDIHINAMEGAIKKDGPSAGIALTTAIISSIIDKKISNKIAMTGEMTLKGNILPIGGLKEKAIGAYNSEVNKIFIPKENEKDLEEIPDEIKNNLKIILVSKYEEIYKQLFK